MHVHHKLTGASHGCAVVLFDKGYSSKLKAWLGLYALVARLDPLIVSINMYDSDVQLWPESSIWKDVICSFSGIAEIKDYTLPTGLCEAIRGGHMVIEAQTVYWRFSDYYETPHLSTVYLERILHGDRSGDQKETQESLPSRTAGDADFTSARELQSRISAC